MAAAAAHATATDAVACSSSRSCCGSRRWTVQLQKVYKIQGHLSNSGGARTVVDQSETAAASTEEVARERDVWGGGRDGVGVERCGKRVSNGEQRTAEAFAYPQMFAPGPSVVGTS